ncbi:DUF6233 domain-containing protein [Streptomyces sp. NPDC054766]
MRDGRGPARSVLHVPDCEEAPQGAPLLDVDRAPDAAEHPSTRLCIPCGAARELTLLLRGFDHTTDSAPLARWPGGLGFSSTGAHFGAGGAGRQKPLTAQEVPTGAEPGAGSREPGAVACT